MSLEWYLVILICVIAVLAFRITMKERDRMTEQEKADEQFKDAW